MDSITQKIIKQSKVILVLAKVTRIILYVVIGVTVFMLISTWVGSDQPIFSFGNTKVYATIPVRVLLGVDIVDSENTDQIASMRVDLFAQLLGFILSQVMLKKITGLFTHILESKDPFTAEAAKPMKVFAVLLGVIIGVQNTILGVVVALVIYAFAMIFEYGALLQTQVDETL